MSSPSSPDSATHGWRAQIESLITKATRDEAIEGLGSILGNFGKILSIELLPSDSRNSLFLIDFENPEDAISASFELNYLLFGHSTLVIQAPRHNTSAK